MFDPFNDYETKGYLRNLLGEKDLRIIKHLEHSSFVAGISEAFKYLASVKKLFYRDVLHTHKLLFGDIYPWAGQDRAQAVPDIAVSKGNVLFAHPQDARVAVEYALRVGSDPALMKEKSGEVMGYLAYGHHFLDGNGRTIMVVHTELAQRAGISIDWAATGKTAYLTALTKELEKPGAGLLDAYLKPFIRKAVEADVLVDHIVGTRGLDGSEETAEENKIFGKVSDPEVQATYQKQKVQRRKRS
ncbi:MAG: Fic family protein [Syntrophobacteraceae bacterium]